MNVVLDLIQFLGMIALPPILVWLGTKFLRKKDSLFMQYLGGALVLVSTIIGLLFYYWLICLFLG
jgi:hypothetical protein